MLVRPANMKGILAWNDKVNLTAVNDRDSFIVKHFADSLNTEEILTDIIDKLPSLQQMIIKMKDIHNYKVNEIAHITGTTAEAVRMNLSRARHRVREEYLKISER